MYWFFFYKEKEYHVLTSLIDFFVSPPFVLPLAPAFGLATVSALPIAFLPTLFLDSINGLLDDDVDFVSTKLELLLATFFLLELDPLAFLFGDFTFFSSSSSLLSKNSSCTSAKLLFRLKSNKQKLLNTTLAF
ncbi:hypothetical protein AYI69_g5274 [Smittium culicis]|uniref:Uncharacterized protein n=1 Tax=Smittium culicis TaxID=133412 RepID=A0A1R1Y727_9FUNG|nr:hypothetical protein AYI69_g5274 [Smittium culicis]